MRIKSCVNLKVKTNIILKFRYDVPSDWLKKRALLKYKTHSKSCHIICHQLYNIICILIYTVCFQVVFLIISRFSWPTTFYQVRSGQHLARWALNFWRKPSTHDLVGRELDQTSGSQPTWMGRLARIARPTRTVLGTWGHGMASIWLQ